MPILSPMIVGFIVGLLAVAGSVVDASHAATFEPIATVVMHPRCINCHQDQSPRQGDARTVHVPLVVRGKDGHGAPTQPCQTCHQTTNTADGFVPGVADWHLAPLSMLWEGRSKEQICEQIKDPAQRRPSHGRASHRAHEDGSARPLGLGPRHAHDSPALAREVRRSAGGLGQSGDAVPLNRERVQIGTRSAKFNRGAALLLSFISLPSEITIAFPPSRVH